MGDNSGIEWTDSTWNPTVGCTKVSPGCDHCYAETLVDTRMHPASMARASRLAAAVAETGDGGDSLAVLTSSYLADQPFPTPFDVVSLRSDKFLMLPLTWREPRMVFVNSLSDLFHADVPDEFIARVFVVMAMAGQHTFQLLTKRHARMHSLLTSEAFQVLAGRAAFDLIQQEKRAVGWVWPLPNVWLGVSVENQQWADIRIPALLDTPADVRFLSCEPLLGPIDLTPWLPSATCLDCGHAETLHYFEPRDHEYARTVGCQAGDGSEDAPICGCRKLRGERQHNPGDPYQNHGLHWVIAGGESGRGARPMHTGWAEALRNQCVEAGVPFLFKQHGEYIGYTEDGDLNGVGRSPWADRDPDLWVGQRTGRTCTIDEEINDESSLAVYRVGKKTAGRELDGRTWDEYPAGAR